MKPKYQYTKQNLISDLNTYRKSYRVDPDDQIIMVQSESEEAAFPHNHDFCELVYIQSGRGVHVVNKKSMLVSAGDLFMIKMEDTHAIYPLADQNQPFQWMTCVFLPEFAECDVSPFVSERKYYGTDGYEIGFIFRMMFQEYLEKESGYRHKLKWYLLVLLTEMARLDDIPNGQISYGSLKKQTIVKQAVAFIRQHYTQKLKIEDISSGLSISTSYLSKVFKESNGVSIVQYLNKYRIEQSCKLLTHTSLSIRGVALESGFTDDKFFRVFFRRELGITPSEYRIKGGIKISTNPE